MYNNEIPFRIEPEDMASPQHPQRAATRLEASMSREERIPVRQSRPGVKGIKKERIRFSQAFPVSEGWIRSKGYIESSSDEENEGEISFNRWNQMIEEDSSDMGPSKSTEKSKTRDSKNTTIAPRKPKSSRKPFGPHGTQKPPSRSKSIHRGYVDNDCESKDEGISASGWQTDVKKLETEEEESGVVRRRRKLAANRESNDMPLDEWNEELETCQDTPNSSQLICFNCRGVQSSWGAIQHLCADASIVLLQETQVHPSRLPPAPVNFTWIPQSSESFERKKGGGVAILIRESIPHAQIRTSSEHEILAIALLNSDIVIATAYNRPRSTRELTAISKFFREHSSTPVLLAGDLNARHPRWDTKAKKGGTRAGSVLNQIVQLQGLRIVNATGSTRAKSNIDLVIVNKVGQSVGLAKTWKGLMDSRGPSDHTPIQVVLGINLDKKQPLLPLHDVDGLTNALAGANLNKRQPLSPSDEDVDGLVVDLARFEMQQQEEKQGLDTKVITAGLSLRVLKEKKHNRRLYAVPGGPSILLSPSSVSTSASPSLAPDEKNTDNLIVNADHESPTAKQGRKCPALNSPNSSLIPTVSKTPAKTLEARLPSPASESSTASPVDSPVDEKIDFSPILNSKPDTFDPLVDDGKSDTSPRDPSHVTPVRVVPQEKSSSFKPNMRVRVVKKGKYEGEQGSVTKFLSKKGRWGVRLASTGKKIAIEPEGLVEIEPEDLRFSSDDEAEELESIHLAGDEDQDQKVHKSFQASLNDDDDGWDVRRVDDNLFKEEEEKEEEVSESQVQEGPEDEDEVLDQEVDERGNLRGFVVDDQDSTEEDHKSAPSGENTPELAKRWGISPNASEPSGEWKVQTRSTRKKLKHHSERKRKFVIVSDSDSSDNDNDTLDNFSKGFNENLDESLNEDLLDDLRENQPTPQDKIPESSSLLSSPLAVIMENISPKSSKISPEQKRVKVDSSDDTDSETISPSSDKENVNKPQVDLAPSNIISPSPSKKPTKDMPRKVLSELPSWTCKRCTYINHNTLSEEVKCEMCGEGFVDRNRLSSFLPKKNSSNPITPGNKKRTIFRTPSCSVGISKPPKPPGSSHRPPLVPTTSSPKTPYTKRRPLFSVDLAQDIPETPMSAYKTPKALVETPNLHKTPLNLTHALEGLRKTISGLNISESKDRKTPLGKSRASSTPLTETKRKVLRKKERERLTMKWFKHLNMVVFGNRLPENMKIEWTNSLNKTAGETYYKLRPMNNERFAEIRLAIKVLDTEEKLKQTLCHELCHAACWIIDRLRNAGHGLAFKRWARVSEEACPGMKVTTCHNYKINYKFRWKCSNEACGREFGRHSNSIDITRQACGACGSHLKALGRFRKDGTPIKTPRRLNAFASFVQKNYRETKAQNHGISHKDLMKIISREYSEEKENKQALDNI
ncbi:hypothetical protein AAMO2058_000246200 [Amorphochlora amoebiformis]